MEPNLEGQLPIIPIAIGFLGLVVASAMLQKKLRNRHLRREEQIETADGRIPSIEERVAANSAWSKGEIRSKGRSLVAGVWLLAAVWNLTFGASFLKQLSNPEMKTGGLIVLGVFATLGLVPIAFALRLTMRQLRFGESLCRVTGKAGVIGQGIKGTISNQAEIKPEGDYTITLQCVEIYSVGSGKNRTSKTEVHWQGKTTVARGSASSRAGIPFSIEIPKFPPETGYQLSRGPINWQLSISAPTKGVDYAALFIVPVFKMD